MPNQYKNPFRKQPFRNWLPYAEISLLYHTSYLTLFIFKISCQSKKSHSINFKGFFKIYTTLNKINYSKEFGKVFLSKVLNDEADLSN